MIDSRSCSISTVEKTTALNIVNFQALAYITGERILAKSLFLPTSNKGVFHISLNYIQGLKHVLDMYQGLENIDKLSF